MWTLKDKGLIVEPNEYYEFNNTIIYEEKDIDTLREKLIADLSFWGAETFKGYWGNWSETQMTDIINKRFGCEKE